jgi:hypothetical protein
VLQTLNIGDCGLSDEVLRPLFAAVAKSTTLRKLDCRRNNISVQFALSVVLPAIRSNTSLRELRLDQNSWVEPAWIKAIEAIVHAR